MKSYRVLNGGFLFGMYREAGAVVRLSEAQAEMFVREGRVEPAAVVRPAAPLRASTITDEAVD